MPLSVPSINNGSNQASFQVNSLKELEKNPENFPLFMAQMTNNNVNSLFSITDPFSSENEGDSFFGSSGSSADIFSMFNGYTSPDPISSMMGTQGFSFDTSFMSPTATLDSFQVTETLKELAAYSNLKETQAWLNQIVEYIDPFDSLTKTGRVEQVLVENVYKPVFVIDGIEVERDNITKLLSSELETTLT